MAVPPVKACLSCRRRGAAASATAQLRRNAAGSGAPPADSAADAAAPAEAASATQRGSRAGRAPPPLGAAAGLREAQTSASSNTGGQPTASRVPERRDDVARRRPSATERLLAAAAASSRSAPATVRPLAWDAAESCVKPGGGDDKVSTPVISRSASIGIGHRWLLLQDNPARLEELGAGGEQPEGGLRVLRANARSLGQAVLCVLEDAELPEGALYECLGGIELRASLHELRDVRLGR